MKDPYIVLGISESATEEELRERYETLKAEYREKRFLPGEEGNIAARKLTELEDAWAAISQKLEQNKYSGDYGYIDSIIKDKNYDEAQRLLDAVTDRTAEWHFMQSKVYYYREWLTESRKQLKVALEMDPDNEKYKVALEKMDMKMGNSKTNQGDLHGDDIDAARANAYRGGGQAYYGGGNCLSDCCTAYCCGSLCCDFLTCCCR